MIYYVATERHIRRPEKYLRINPDLRNVLRTLTYEEIFFQRGGPVGHYIFTDHDRLTRFELDCASLFCDALQKVAPDATILNHPARLKDRVPFLLALQKAGINSFGVTRLETGERPPQYPVFLRSEDGCGGPETDLIHNDSEFDSALASLKARGKTLRGRIAVGYAAQAGPDGHFRKYGAYKIGADILPHHIHLGQHWVVKRNVPDLDWTQPNDRSVELRDSAVTEELEYVRTNPHREIINKAFEIAQTEFGRIDYGIVDGRIEIFEINTNPGLPKFTRSDARNVVRDITKAQLVAGFHTLNTPIVGKQAFVRFKLPKTLDHKFRLPVKYLPRAMRRVVQRMFVT